MNLAEIIWIWREIIWIWQKLYESMERYVPHDHNQWAAIAWQMHGYQSVLTSPVQLLSACVDRAIMIINFVSHRDHDNITVMGSISQVPGLADLLKDHPPNVPVPKVQWMPIELHVGRGREGFTVQPDWSWLGRRIAPSARAHDRERILRYWTSCDGTVPSTPRLSAHRLWPCGSGKFANPHQKGDFFCLGKSR